MVFWRRKPKIALEKALEGIVWNPEIVQTCSWKVDGVKKSKRTPLYLAPVREVSGEFEIGLYTEGQGLRYFPFGLSQGRDFTNFYYSFVQGDTNAY